MKRVIIFGVCAFIFSAVFAIPIEDCGSQVGKFINITISSCKGTDPVCILKRNTNVTLEIEFTTTVTDNSVKAEVHGIVQGIPIPWPVHNPNACQSSGLTCPLHPGESYLYKASFQVLKAYPKIHLEVKWELQNENAADIVCALIPVRIM